ncbi:MAG: membrane protein insertion efficiency factor YidD [Spirochaetaceae bacterium]|nr:membrane protein insertion efficiency factor YidD [Spirochaetaceae bacterium]
MPSEEEQEEAWQYVCRRVLERPSVNIVRAARNVFVFIAVNLVLTLVTFLFFAAYIRAVLPFIAMLFSVYMLLGVAVFAKRAIIGLVKLYQHYAPERIRRKCLFKPTCSEYMILALEKYGLVKGVYKSVYRLFFKCRGFVYSVDYP